MHLAQLNIARLTEPLDHPATSEFVAALGPINALAEQSPGYVWRLKDEGGDATGFRPHPDPEVIVNMSVWESPQALTDFVFRSAHTPFLRRRADWFTPMLVPQVVAWWVDEGHQPTVDEAFARLAFLTEHGPSPYAFSVTRPQRRLAIRRVDLDDFDARALIGELNSDLTARYPELGGSHFRLDPDEVGAEDGVLLLAALDGEPVACGAFRVMTSVAGSGAPATAEIKRMYTRPTARGLKIGASVLTELEQRAAALGVVTMQLETGRRQPEALTRYERAGYRSRGSSGDDSSNTFIVWMSKELIRS